MSPATSNAGGTETKNYENPEPGPCAARCIQCVELGTHEKIFSGDKKNVKELMIVWELSELMEDGRPFVVNWKGTNSLNEKSNLYKMLTSWRGNKFTEQELQNFELKNILDKCCMVNIVVSKNKETGREYRNVGSVMPLPKGMTCNERVNDLVDFGITDVGTPEFEKLYPWVQNIVLKSKEVTGDWGEQPLPGTEDHPDESIPF